MIQDLANATNAYSVEKKGVSINVTHKEMQQYLGILIHMGIVVMSDYRMYWKAETRYDKIANIMNRNRFETIKQYFHIADNTQLPRNRGTGDKLFKVRPLYDHVLNNCRQIEPEEYHSIDEQMIPYKGKSSSMRQYNPKKPKKWGFKVITRTSICGIVYDYFLYTGADTYDDWLEQPEVSTTAMTNLTEHVQNGHDEHESVVDEPDQFEPELNEQEQIEPIEFEAVQTELHPVQNEFNNDQSHFEAISFLAERSASRRSLQDLSDTAIITAFANTSTPNRNKRRVSFNEDLVRTMIFQTDSSLEELEYSIVENRKPSNVSKEATRTRSSINITKSVSVIQTGAVTRHKATVDRSNTHENNVSCSSESDEEEPSLSRKEKYKNAPKAMLAVLRLTERLDRDLNYKLFYDNWFSSLRLIKELLSKGFHSVATIRMNRFDGDFPTKTKEFEKKERGSYEMLVNKHKNIALVRWLDSKAVHLISTYIGLEPIYQVKRWSKERRQKVDLDAPAIVKVNLFDNFFCRKLYLFLTETYSFINRNTTHLWVG